MLAMLYHKIDHASPFVKMLTQQNSNLSCNLQWEIYYLTVLFYFPWNWRACLIGDNDHKWKDFQYSWKHARNQILHPILFLQKNFLLKILHNFYKQSIIFGAILQNKKKYSDYLSLLFELVLKSVTDQHWRQSHARKSKAFQVEMTAPSCRADKAVAWSTSTRTYQAIIYPRGNFPTDTMRYVTYIPNSLRQKELLCSFL